MKDIHSPATLLVTQGDLLIHADIQLANYVMQRLKFSLNPVKRGKKLDLSDYTIVVYLLVPSGLV